MITLGLDPSLTGFGWAIHVSTVSGPGRVLAKGVLSTAAQELQVARYMYLQGALKEILRAYPEVQNIGAESPPYGEQYSEGLYGLYLYVLEAAFTCRKDIVFFDPGTVKMLVRLDPRIRKGKIDKRDVIDAAVADTTIKKWNHNEADAYIVARSTAHFWEFLDGSLTEEDLVPSEAQAFLGRAIKSGRTGGASSKEGSRFFRFSNLSEADIRVTAPPISRREG